MWETEKKHKRVVLSIFLVLLILALLAGLYYAYKLVKAQEEVQDAELLQVYEEHQKELNAAKQANYDTLEALYQQDLDTVKTYLPGVVCWGDVTTTGSAGGVNYPARLQEMIDAAICDKYDFYNTLEDKTSYGRITDWTVYDVDIPVVNMGGGKENTLTVAGRNGAIPFVVAEDFTIPVTTDRVPIKLKSSGEAIIKGLMQPYEYFPENLLEVDPLTQGNAGINNVVINGVEGTLSLDMEVYSFDKRTNYYFTRLTPGMETKVREGTEITTAASSMYRDYIPVIFTGNYDNQYSTVNQLIAFQKEMINHQIANKDRYLIIGPYYLEGRWDSGTTSDLDIFETSMLQEYGDHFINIRKYLCSDGLTDAGITITKQDQDDIAHGLVPSSLRSTSDPSELNAIGYRLLGRVVFNRMDQLNYFKEVKDELGITAIEKLERQEAAKTTGK